MLIFGGPWLIVVALLSAFLKLGRRNILHPVLVTAGLAIILCFTLIFAGPLIQAHSWEATRAECARLGHPF